MDQLILCNHCNRMSIFKKLFTSEDANYGHMHKTFGTLCLVNFIHRLYNFISLPDHSLGFNINSYTFLYTICVHTLLHITSFQFILSPRRNAVYNIIWPEMRWHSLIFAYRSIIAMGLFYMKKYYIFGLSRFALVIFTMIMADVTTKLLPPSNNTTTMRGNPYPKDTHQSIIKNINLFYSISQVFATLHILFAPSPDYIFLTLIPIQTAPFGMTLQRKGIISQYGWHVFYILAILSNYIYATVNIYKATTMWFYMILFSVLRFKYKHNKYVLWSLIYTIDCFSIIV